MEVPVEIRVPDIQYINVVEYRDKPIIVHQTKEIPVPIELKVEKEIIREVVKEIIVERSHFIKGDKEEVIREVEVFVDRPIIKEMLTTRDVEIEKVVPLYITEQTPVYTEVSVPYVSEKVRELEVEKVRIVPVKE